MQINTALILCAGFGKRLNPITLENPKPLLVLKNQTLLETNINLVQKLGIKKILINIFYLKEKIFKFIDQKKFKIDIEIIDDGDKILDTGGGLLNMIKNSTDDNFIVFNPDTVWGDCYLENIKAMEKNYFSKQINNILLVVNKQQSFDVDLTGDFNLKKDKLNKDDPKNFIYTGCQIINKKVFLNTKSKIFSILDIWTGLIDNKELFGFEDKNKFHHVTNLAVYKKLLKSN